MYDFLRRPAWIVSHVLVAIGVLAMIGLGFWQRQRWIDERVKSDALAAQAAGTPVPLDEALADSGVDASTAPAAVPESVEFRRVEVSGVYDAAGEVLVRNRSQGGAPGAWVLTPLVQKQIEEKARDKKIKVMAGKTLDEVCAMHYNECEGYQRVLAEEKAKERTTPDSLRK